MLYLLKFKKMEKFWIGRTTEAATSTDDLHEECQKKVYHIILFPCFLHIMQYSFCLSHLFPITVVFNFMQYEALINENRGLVKKLSNAYMMV